LVEEGKYYFLSRPRRFGKSLLVDTLKEILEGNQSLFEGLWIHDNWDWNQKHPVIHIPFAKLNYQGEGLAAVLAGYMDECAAAAGLQLSAGDHKDKFLELVELLHQTQGKVAILIDEYDKPIIDYIGNQIERAQENGRILKTFYSIIKDSDALLKFVFITGVSKFSKASIFSDLNNLRDITMSDDFATICGYTQEELEYSFEEHLQALGGDKEEWLAGIRKWYNGYTWNNEDFVFNPFSVLNFLSLTKAPRLCCDKLETKAISKNTAPKNPA
jgi:hypothetical protein